MSARYVLIEGMKNLHLEWSSWTDEEIREAQQKAEDLVNAYRDEVLRKAAKRIREHAYTPGGSADDFLAAAELIDPDI